MNTVYLENILYPQNIIPMLMVLPNLYTFGKINKT